MSEADVEASETDVGKRGADAGRVILNGRVGVATDAGVSETDAGVSIPEQEE
ncbi:MAG: hypothetical protein HS102_12165 [Planctomycetia bacterium]|nr:hypothetical protein [Planctomycetia bacterium]